MTGNLSLLTKARLGSGLFTNDKKVFQRIGLSAQWKAMQMKTESKIIEWLLEGDPAVRWQVQRDLLGEPASVYEAEQAKIAQEGMGARLLELQDPDGRWGRGLYSPKWISTTYTLLTLRRFGLEPRHPQALRGCGLLLQHGYGPDGGIDFHASSDHAETCITGMVLSLLAHFHYPDARIHDLVEHLLIQQMPDGGWNCESYRGATHSSFHTTLSVLEGLHEYCLLHPKHVDPVLEAQARAREFLLEHRLYRSHRTGKIVKPAMTRFPFPPRWYYDFLKGLDYFQSCRAEKDERLRDPIDLLLSKRRKDGTWAQYRGPSGRTFFEIEKAGQPGRFNTLRALRVQRWWHTD